MKNIYAIIGSILIFVIIIWFIPSEKSWNCNRQIDFNSKPISGIIIKRYIDETQHAYRTLDVLDSSKIVKKWTIFPKYFFDRVDSGDYIVKRVSDSTIFVRKPNGDTARILIDFGCKE